MSPRGHVLYLHGLESGPQAGKVLALRAAGFDVTAPALDTAEVVALRQEGEVRPETYQEALARPVAQALEALHRSSVDVIVGSSFGAAVLLQLLHEGHGVEQPTVLLAGAGLRLTTHRALPTGTLALLVHGLQDDVVPPADSRTLAASCSTAVLVEVHDDHRLTHTTASGLLAGLVQLAQSRGRSAP